MNFSSAFNKVVNYILTLLLIISFLFALLIRCSYNDYSMQYGNYHYISACTKEEFEILLDRYDINTVQDIFNLSDTVVIASCETALKIYDSVVSCNVKVEKVLKGDIIKGDSIKVLETVTFNDDKKTVSNFYGGVPLLLNNEYILFLNKQNQHKKHEEKVYYITSESPLGKYLIDGNFYKNDNSTICLNDLKTVSFVAQDDLSLDAYKKFYFEIQSEFLR